MSDAPKRIWAFCYGDDWPELLPEEGGFWWQTVADNTGGTEYVRADEIERLQAELREAREAMTSARESLYSLTHLLLPDEPGFEKAVDGLEELDAFLAKP